MPPIHVLTNRHDDTRVGANQAETTLKVDNVNVNVFGKLFTRAVDGDLFAQPLLYSGLDIAGTRRNVVFLATSRNSVYAYDADDPEACLPLWTRNLGNPMPRDDIFKQLGQFNDHYLNFGGEIGITSTPVIEPEEGGGILYVVAKTRVVSGVGGGVSRSYFQRIHALDLATGRDAAIPNNPVEIRATARRKDGTTITFDPVFQLNRPGLLLLKGVLYLAFGSHTDIGEFYGWVMAYDARTLDQLAVYCTAPDWGEGGIWQSGCGLAGDDEGFVYAVVGNGEKPTTYYEKNRGHLVPDVSKEGAINEPAYGNCILKLALTRKSTADSGYELEVLDWYTAPDTLDLNDRDTDLMSGPVLFEAGENPGVPKRKQVLGGGKDGRFYLLHRQDMGKWRPLKGGKPSGWRVPDDQGDDAMGPMHMHHHGAGGEAPTKKSSDPAWIPWKGGERPDNADQDDQLCYYHIHGSPVLWRTGPQSEITAFVWSEKDALRSFRYKEGKFRDYWLDGTRLVLLDLEEKKLPEQAENKKTIVVARTKDGLQFVTYEENTATDVKNPPPIQLIHKSEKELIGRAEAIERLESLINAKGLWNSSEISDEDRLRIISEVLPILSAVRKDRTTSDYRFPQDEMRMPGGFLSLSSDGDVDGTAIVWASHPTDDDAMNKTVRGTLRAFDARDLRQELWNSDQDSYGADRAGNFAKNVSPVVANGKVYLATFSRELVVYGLYSSIGQTRLIQSAGVLEFRRFGGRDNDPIDGKCSASCDRYELSALGGRIDGLWDSFAFAYRVIDLPGNGILGITVQLTGIVTQPYNVSQPDAVAGIMIRKFDEDGYVPGLRHAALLVTVGNNGQVSPHQLQFVARKLDQRESPKSLPDKRRLKNDQRSEVVEKREAHVPIWLRLLCEPTDASQKDYSFVAAYSEDGIDWKEMGRIKFAMDGRVMVGLVGASQVEADPAKNQNPSKVQARFSQVKVTPMM